MTDNGIENSMDKCGLTLGDDHDSFIDGSKSKEPLRLDGKICDFSPHEIRKVTSDLGEQLLQLALLERDESSEETPKVEVTQTPEGIQETKIDKRPKEIPETEVAQISEKVQEVEVAQIPQEIRGMEAAHMKEVTRSLGQELVALESIFPPAQ